MTTAIQAGPLPITMATLYELADGTYSDDPSSGGVPTQVPVTDLLCIDDLDPNGGETTSDLQSLAQDVYHILLEPLGSNLDDPARGVGFAGLLSAPSTKLAAAANICDSQLRKDSRIQGSQTTLVQNSDGSYSVSVQITVAGGVLPLSYTYSKQTGLVVAPGIGG
jgi:phage baseplate assembly protein W